MNLREMAKRERELRDRAAKLYVKGDAKASDAYREWERARVAYENALAEVKDPKRSRLGEFEVGGVFRPYNIAVGVSGGFGENVGQISKVKRDPNRPRNEQLFAWAVLEEQKRVTPKTRKRRGAKAEADRRQPEVRRYDVPGK